MAGFRPNYYYSSPQFASIGQNIGSIFGGASPEDQARANLILSQIRENEAQTGKTSYETEQLKNRDNALVTLGDLLANDEGELGQRMRRAYGQAVLSGEDLSKFPEFFGGYGFQTGAVQPGSSVGDAFMLGAGKNYADTAAGFGADQARQERDSQRDDATTRRGQDITSADTRLGDRMTDWRERQKFITANELEREKNEALDKREREKLEIERTKPFTANVNERVYGRTADGGIGMLFDADPSARTITAADGAIVADAAGNKILENPKDPVGGKGTKTTLDANGNVVVEPVEAVKTPDLDDFLKAVSIQLGALSADGALGGLDVPPEALSAVAARAAEIATSGVPAPAAINQAIKEMVVSNPAVDNWGPSNTPPSVGLRAAPAAPAVQGGDAPPVNDDPPPPAALSRLREGYASKFENGQVWTLQNGKPVRVK
jgi:hypothetical protein